ncbi:hypothetical protein PIB30_075249 [Stylosanthes scabra]|uniref:Uncharacterized protein n=1 Tax=Stylosanthes scabra TaxID=79078 RepID=A0ABU6XPW0_9FABA|nr:hypothetical protein [Stylosanthes scabra]
MVNKATNLFTSHCKGLSLRQFVARLNDRRCRCLLAYSPDPRSAAKLEAALNHSQFLKKTKKRQPFKEEE